jgi:general nucleoside transport system permease protein
MTDLIIPLLAGTMAAATPLVFAALGELIVEKSGVLNLGVEGMMLMGAVAAFAAATKSGSLWLGVLCGGIAGIGTAAIFAMLTLTLLANQVATGLALTIFGAGLSAFVGKAYVSLTLSGMHPLAVPLLSRIPLLGPVLFQQNALVYVSLAAYGGIHWFLYQTKAGLVLRAVGESPESAHAVGYRVIAIRYAATLFGGALAGVAGAYLAVAYTPMWVEQMAAGRGWIALALVVFATWRPSRVLLGAYLFGGVTILQFHAQALGIAVPAEFLSSLPYLATILVLVLISRNYQTIRLNSPVSLGRPFHPGD